MDQSTAPWPRGTATLCFLLSLREGRWGNLGKPFFPRPNPTYSLTSGFLSSQLSRRRGGRLGRRGLDGTPAWAPGSWTAHLDVKPLSYTQRPSCL